jgi:DNA primase
MRPGELRALADRIKANIDIAEIIGARVQLNRSLKACCPFHEERIPSFSVNSRAQYFHCFGCGVGGDVIKFLMLYERIGFVEALAELAEHVGIDMPKSLRGK